MDEKAKKLFMREVRHLYRMHHHNVLAVCPLTKPRALETPNI